MIEFLEENYMSIPSTFIPMRPSKRVTFRNIQASEFANTTNPAPDDFAVLDYFIAPIEEISAFRSIYSDTLVSFPSRHFPLL